MNHKSQHGAALIIVLFIVALASILAVEMSANLLVQVQKSTNIQGHQQAKWYAYAAEELAIKALLQSKKDDPEKTTLKQIWAQQGDIPYPVDNGTLQGKITDLQACLNLNALRVKAPQAGSTDKTNPAHTALLALLENIEDLPAEESEEAMADSVYDWLDEDSITYRSGAEEDEYLSRKSPYMTANSFFASSSELRLVKGFNPLVMEKILPYVCVIPGSELLAINVNTIAPEQALLLSALIDGLSESGAQSVLSVRPEEGFNNIEEFFEQVNQQGAQNVKSVEKLFTINSEYFKLQAQAKFVDLRFSMTTLLHAKDGEVTILARKFGGVQ
ncbi:type II secretion system minor pseudopilin GspK [Pseudoalteromonas sp. SR44-5]|jgi:general secretion pathway protein K|uniref:Type II secretion system protein K n=1 Tax=Pseudoalteromonas neustonica TaxID=1840331 RepID=A0ABY3F778_9GAMM|nr:MULTISPECIES: type II secretion system minor pseudopilin GspK [Pseudoalteromonas]MBB1295426.1 type II secretion system minor pseudopilin GspK [Pseudoalteromonas sp. SR41-4]MBB1303624.1 type II secretion system minor pseudopilin GspK [Pseudoalteromonas sp. SR44-8]MBB1311628.1 type II secretion system minor pseudopilin GspK [Pseudoalteromonas sp. SR41-8]MBB1335536.1 type II secretion system minor pseudopilin GspK [Pseudoalteromonas sp. SR41-6]MBB1343743.1 type II secretion system minor pseudo|tara:strand:+ start:15244 stop:16233 length:990 start_codon:yes stop_codon:yes gene_type:complete